MLSIHALQPGIIWLYSALSAPAYKQSVVQVLLQNLMYKKAVRTRALVTIVLKS